MLEAFVPFSSVHADPARGLLLRSRLWTQVACRISRSAHVVDHAKAILINFACVTDQFWSALARHFHVQECHVAVPHVSFHFCDTITSLGQSLRQFEPLASEERCDLK